MPNVIFSKEKYRTLFTHFFSKTNFKSLAEIKKPLYWQILTTDSLSSKWRLL